MGIKYKFYVHPLFYILGIYFAFTGKVFSFLIYTFTALLHELGHAFVSEKLGYMLKKVVLMPYGAVISGDLTGLKFADEISVAMAGPLLNFFVAVFFIATWWLFPDSYAFTDIIVEANLSLALVNLIPVYPLDGGRVLYATIAKRSEKKAIIVSRILTVILFAVLFGLFVYSTIIKKINITLLFFAIFILVGGFSRGKDNKYVKYYSQFNSYKLKKGQEEKTLIFDKNATVKDLLAKINPDSLYLVKILDEKDKVIKTFSCKKVLKILEEENLYTQLHKIA